MVFISCNRKKSTQSSNHKVYNVSVSMADEKQKNLNTKSNPKSERQKDNSINESFDEYFMTIKDSTVSLCCLEKLYNPFGSISTKDISSILPTYSVTKSQDDNSERTFFKKDENLVSIVNWKSEYSENDYEVFLGEGKLTDKNINLKNGLKIGMSKSEFMVNYLHFPDSIINKLNQVSVCQDERGNSFTKYKFTNDTLSIIKFGEWDEYE